MENIKSKLMNSVRLRFCNVLRICREQMHYANIIYSASTTGVLTSFITTLPNIVTLINEICIYVTSVAIMIVISLIHPV